jgi:diaminopimelate decarboxylase
VVLTLAAPASFVDEVAVVRRCAMYRHAFRGTAVSYPAELLRLDEVASWIGHRNATVDVASAEELRLARSAGILMAHTVMRCADVATPPIHCAVNRGVARFVVDSAEQIGQLASGMGRTRQVVVDVTAPHAVTLVAEVAGQPRLTLIGLHSRVSDAGESAADVVQRLIAQMAMLRRMHPPLLTRVSVAGVDGGHDPRSVRHAAAAIGDAVETACIRYRYPRPALTVSPSRGALRLH